MEYGFKGSSVNPLVPTTIIDDFFETPNLWREFALSQEYFKGDRGTWPGIRTKYIQDLHPELYEVFEHTLLKHVKKYNSFSKIEATFQAIDGSWGNGWVHDDNPEHDVAGVVFLNPNPPLGTGNTVYANTADINADHYIPMFQQDMDPEFDHSTLEKYRNEQRAIFKPVVTAENRFNRCVMFDPRCWHSADNFFGTCLEDSRLTLVFFCNGG